MKNTQEILNILPKEFYKKDTIVVVKNILGKKLVRNSPRLALSFL
jgi:3-methyladenine DNA glycosylase Mpg